MNSELTCFLFCNQSDLAFFAFADINKGVNLWAVTVQNEPEFPGMQLSVSPDVLLFRKTCSQFASAVGGM
jgi:hypothetical protein